jgi:hypothetical protein
MSIHTEMLNAITIPIAEDRRLVVDHLETVRGVRLVRVAVEYKDRIRGWQPSAPALLLRPRIARQLAPAILAMAATIDAGPVDPMPTEHDREESRMP